MPLVMPLFTSIKSAGIHYFRQVR